MKRQFLIFYTLTLCSIHSYSSEPTGIFFRNVVSFDLTTPCDLYSPRVQVGYSVSITDRWQIGSELGYFNMKVFNPLYGILWRDRSSDYTYFGIQLECKYLFNTKTISRPYLAMEFLYVYQTENLYNNACLQSYESSVSVKQSFYLNEECGANLKTGVFIMIIDNIAIEPYVGAGVRYKININSSFQDISYTEEPYFKFYDWNMPEKCQTKRYFGDDFDFEYTIGVKIDIKF